MEVASGGDRKWCEGGGDRRECIGLVWVYRVAGFDHGWRSIWKVNRTCTLFVKLHCFGLGFWMGWDGTEWDRRQLRGRSLSISIVINSAQRLESKVYICFFR